MKCLTKIKSLIAVYNEKTSSSKEKEASQINTNIKISLKYKIKKLGKLPLHQEQHPHNCHEAVGFSQQSAKI